MNSEIVLRGEFANAWKGLDPFKEIEKLEGELFRNVKSRRTMRIEFENNFYFIKIHRGVGWGEIFKNLFQFKRPVLGASNEFYALEKLHEIGVPTMTACAYGQKNSNPANRYSFLITDELKSMVSLEDYTLPWYEAKAEFKERYILLSSLADNTKKMHGIGINHRDCYICHFLFNIEDKTKLYIIDLHRAEMRKNVPYRYLVKDVAGLYFSAMDINLTKNDFLRFIKLYSKNNLRYELNENIKFWNDVKKTAIKLYKKVHKKEPKLNA